MMSLKGSSEENLCILNLYFDGMKEEQILTLDHVVKFASNSYISLSVFW